MQRRPNNGAVSVYEAPKSFVNFSTAEIGLIDSVTSSNDVYPYAEVTILENDIQDILVSLLQQSNLVAGARFAFGVFLLPDFDRIAPSNLQAMVSMSMDTYQSGGSPSDLSVIPIIGRTVASTITSTKAAQANLLSTWSPIDKAEEIRQTITGTSSHIKQSTVGDVFLRLDLEPGGSDPRTPIFFGYLLITC